MVPLVETSHSSLLRHNDWLAEVPVERICGLHVLNRVLVAPFLLALFHHVVKVLCHRARLLLLAAFQCSSVENKPVGAVFNGRLAQTRVGKCRVILVQCRRLLLLLHNA